MMFMKQGCVWVLMLTALQAPAMGLVESYALAVKKEPRLKAATLNVDASKLELEKAKAGYLPKVQLSLNQGRGSTDAETGVAFSSGQRNYTTKNYALTLKQPLLNFGLSPEKNKASENIAIQELQLQSEAQNLFSRLTEKYFNVLYASDVLRSQQNKLNSLERQRIQADKRFRAGVAIKNDLTDLDAELALIKAQILEAESRLNASQKEFQLLVGVVPERLMGLDYQKLKGAELNQRTMDDWMAAARLKNPELLQAEKEISVSSWQHEKDKALHYPTLDLLISRSRTESDSNITIGSKFDTLSGLLQLNVPVYLGGYVTANAQQSAVLIEVARENQAIKQTQVLEKISQEYQNLYQAKHLIEAYDQAIRYYEQSLNGAAKAYAAGTRTLSDVLKLRDRLTDTQLSLSKTCYSYLVSYIHLRELTGETDSEDFIQFDSMLRENAFAFSEESLASLMELDTP